MLNEKVKSFLLLLICSMQILFSHAQSLVYTYGGTGVAGLTNGALAGSQFNQPFGICRDKNGIIYVADTYNNCIRKIEAGIVSTYAGSIVAGYLDGAALTAQFNQPLCLCVDDSGNLFVTDFMGQRVRKISYSGIVSTVAGNGIEGYADGIDTSAEFDYPRGITIDAAGNLFIADSWNHRIRKIDTTAHVVSTYAGGGSVTGVGTAGGNVDAADTAARFHTPTGIAIDSTGNLYVADALNHRIRMIDTAKQVTTIAGSGTAGGFLDGTALTARLNTPTDLFRSVSGDIFIGDTYNNRVRLLSNGMLSTFAGNGTTGFVNGASSSAEFNYTRGITANDNADSLWAIDYNNNAIRLIATTATGISEHPKNNVQIFPNPIRNTLHIQVREENNSFKIFLTDVTGKTVFSSEGANNFEYNTTDLSTGIYILKIQTSTTLLNYKIVKE